MVTSEERINTALMLRKKGYNCAQCVAMVYDPSLEGVSAGLGIGLAGTGHICGCCTAMAMLISQKAYVLPTEKAALYSRIRGAIEKFADRNEGDTDCRDLRRPGRKPCAELIKDAIEIIEDEALF